MGIVDRTATMATATLKMQRTFITRGSKLLGQTRTFTSTRMDQSRGCSFIYSSRVINFKINPRNHSPKLEVKSKWRVSYFQKPRRHASWKLRTMRPLWDPSVRCLHLSMRKSRFIFRRLDGFTKMSIILWNFFWNNHLLYKSLLTHSKDSWLMYVIITNFSCFFRLGEFFWALCNFCSTYQFWHTRNIQS